MKFIPNYNKLTKNYILQTSGTILKASHFEMQGKRFVFHSCIETSKWTESFVLSNKNQV